jgi:hypothetical protein
VSGGSVGLGLDAQAPGAGKPVDAFSSSGSIVNCWAGLAAEVVNAITECQGYCTPFLAMRSKPAAGFESNFWRIWLEDGADPQGNVNHGGVAAAVACLETLIFQGLGPDASGARG